MPLQIYHIFQSPTKSVKVYQSNPVTNSEKIKESTSNPELKNHPMFKNNIASKKKALEKVSQLFYINVRLLLLIKSIQWCRKLFNDAGKRVKLVF